MKIHIQGGRLIDPANGVDAVNDIYIAAGRVVGIGQAPAGFVPNRLIDARGLAVLPGLVDLSARLREPGFEHRATLESELQAALAGGVTSLVLPPDTDPVLDEPGLVEMLKHRARQLNQSHVYPLGAMTVGLKGEIITEMAELTEAGCVAFSQADAHVTDTNVLLRAMQYARTFDYALWLRPEDPWLAREGVAASGAMASRLGLAGIPEQAETIALHTLFELQRATRARLHLCRISSAAGIELVRRARAEGLPVTCDVSAHHVHLTDVDIGYFDAHCRLTPPLRGQRDRDAIRAALADGTIDAICSDHTPVDEDYKLLPFGEAEPGATGLELLLSLALKWARDADLPLSRAVARVTSEPARVLGTKVLASCGQLGAGALADLCLVDLDAHWLVSEDSLQSQGKHTPFLGMELPGKVRMTIVAGHVAYEAAA
ncbi:MULTISPECIES: dihydroorotase [Pigmentiphaga]|uniref:Dihydroorotase n=1 Tax=Pigmentiphaga daeguensis TaxID=414049 RepID=A0ABN1C4S0_9BURK|nr:MULTISPECIES: dihydroorotase [unclassified Pigmentiphaga]OVZ65484.1 dihydroorotase [Pigmentiphaga sp. NML030171]